MSDSDCDRWQVGRLAVFFPKFMLSAKHVQGLVCHNDGYVEPVDTYQNACSLNQKALAEPTFISSRVSPAVSYK
ncbi:MULTISPECIES: hypothetical protein [unclassified Moorena]|uniref:hypothetical protein n=1 Tax=unclassified Moorena TaxID=2683338 RepID=UPI0025D4CB48|nr:MULTISPECIES: hypothetical protein [unclassified Moorena]